MNNSDFSGWNLDDIILSNADCRYAIFSSVSLKNSTIRMADFTGCNLAEADFRNADLSLSDFKDANLSGVLFDKTQAIGSYFGNTNFKDCDVSKAVNLLSLNKTLKNDGYRSERYYS